MPDWGRFFAIGLPAQSPAARCVQKTYKVAACGFRLSAYSVSCPTLISASGFHYACLEFKSASILTLPTMEEEETRNPNIMAQTLRAGLKSHSTYLCLAHIALGRKKDPFT